jgi:hypothetical protein
MTGIMDETLDISPAGLAKAVESMARRGSGDTIAVPADWNEWLFDAMAEAEYGRRVPAHLIAVSPVPWL